MKFLRIREWEKYQHYKDRNPPWIKLHVELMNSYTWVTVDDASRLLALVLMMLAARTGNKIPLDRGYIQRAAYLRKPPDVQPLIDAGFVDLHEESDSDIENKTLGQVASEALADASTMLAVDTECLTRDRDRDREEKETSLSKRATRLPEKFTPSEEHYAIGKQLGINTDMEFQKFRDYFLGVPGSKGVKLDWNATLRNWLRNSLNYKGAVNDSHKTAAQLRNERSSLALDRAFGAQEIAGDMPEALRKGAGRV